VLVVVGSAIVLLVAVAGAWAIVADDDTGSPNAAPAGQMGRVCQQWMAAHPGSGMSAATCASMAASMAASMNGQMGQPASASNGMPNGMMSNGMMSGGMAMGSMAGHDPAAMQATCEKFMATKPAGMPAGTVPQAWCGQMVAWMAQHMEGMGSMPMTSGSMPMTGTSMPMTGSSMPMTGSSMMGGG
jgi:hypothetical protein